VLGGFDTNVSHLPVMNVHALKARIDSLPRTQQIVGRYLLRHGSDIPFLSVRELSSRAGATPSTVMRLVKSCRFEGYKALQESFKTHFINNASPRLLNSETEHEQTFRLALDSLFSVGQVEQLDRIARLIFQSPCHVAGFRSAYSLSHYLAYLLNMIQHNVFLVPNSESAAFDHLMLAKPDHLLLIFSTSPYASQSVKIATMARESGVRVIAITDSADSPLSDLANELMLVDQVSMNYIPTRISFFALIEYLVETGCSLQDRKSRKELKLFQHHIEQFSGYWAPNSKAFPQPPQAEDFE
jgi:DNA-binding MurR/RpiR family transcriptional regulator